MRCVPCVRLLRLLCAALVVVLGSGCFDFDNESEVVRAISDCRDDPLQQYTYYLAPGLNLASSLPAAGSEPGNAFSSGFLTNDLKEWLSQGVPSGLWLDGNVTIEYWVRSTGTPAPIILGGEPGEGYHFFTQFGSDRSLQPSYAVEYSSVLPMAGDVDHYTEVLELPDGGFVLERGDRVRLLLTDLALDGPSGSGHDVLFGGATPSRVTFSARCFPDLEWESLPVVDQTVVLAANQGLLTGAVPPGDVVNQAHIAVELPSQPQRVTITLQQVGDVNPVKDDIDIVLLDERGRPAWSIGSPYSDESGTLWFDNLNEFFPDGRFTVEVNSYSGLAYQGHLTVLAEYGRLA